jgi:hypothetical protein
LQKAARPGGANPRGRGVERRPASGLIKGIGLPFAKRLVAAFGNLVFNAIDRMPCRDATGLGRFAKVP